MVYESKHPLVKHKLTLLRSNATKPKKFRELVRELALLLCYEATEDLRVKEINVETPMGTAAGSELQDNIGLIPILRAGLGMVKEHSSRYPITTNCPRLQRYKFASYWIQCWPRGDRPWPRRTY
jgi:uracil phosphoribosyltransferase